MHLHFLLVYLEYLYELSNYIMNITLTELFEFCLVVIGIISLCIQAKKK